MRPLDLVLKAIVLPWFGVKDSTYFSHLLEETYILNLAQGEFLPFYPVSDQDLISSYSHIAVPFVKVVRIKEITANLRSFDC